MRRASQRNHLVTLNEINITPLMDLAFVLLIIFVITRPMLEQSMNLQLPSVGKLNTPQQVKKTDIRTVEVGASGIVIKVSVYGRKSRQTCTVAPRRGCLDQ